MLGIGALSVNTVLNIILYHFMGLIGPAVATLIVTALSGAIMLRLDAKVLKMRICELFDLKYLLIFSVESLILAVALSLFAHQLDKWDVHYFVILVLVGGVYCATMFLLNFRRLFVNLKKINGISKKTRV